ncbi:MAG TPA: DUF362 domain-containing protein [Pirellulales bacterium]|jgi:uncharacterized protein (DUF362 family)
MTPQLLEQLPESNSHSPRDAAPAPRLAQIDRRGLLIGAGVVAAGAIGYPLVASAFAAESPVFLARNQRYDSSLERTIRDGLLATRVDLAALGGRRVLLKPNLVEPSRARPQMTTHPAVVVAAAEVFRRYGATVTVGEGPGHVRDTQMALYESSVGAALEDAGVEFADLNYEDVAWTHNAGRASPLAGFWLPQSVATADLIVSLPKLKTHHWVGMTAAMKNLYGVLPGIQYGWPKNVLHHAGIPQTVFDINASLPRTIAIVDGIICMEGDGPILGSAKAMGLIAIGAPVAVDATCARIIGLQPKKIEYLELGRRLGPIDERHIPQRGEAWRELASPFQIVEVPHLQRLRRKDAMLTS